MNADDYIARWKAMDTARGNFAQHWQELAEVLLPQRASFTTQTQPGDKRTVEMLDSTPYQARRDLASAMHAMLFPTHSRWFNIKPVDDELEDNDDAGLWLDDVEKRMWSAIYDPRARFAAATGEAIDDLITFGTNDVFIGTNDAGDRLQFRAHHLKDCWIAENRDGEIDTQYLQRNLTARQAVQMGYESQKIKEALQKNQPETLCQYLHVVMPRQDRDSQRRDNRNMPFVHAVIDVKEQKIVEESGFEEFPFAVARWETAAEEVYGRSPAMIALPDIKTLMAMRRSTLLAAELATFPPVAMPSSTTIGQDSFFPGGTMIYDMAEVAGNPRNAIYPVVSGANIPLGLDMENQTREMIRGAFLKTVLNLPVDGPQMTATEILQRREEFMRMVGPTFGRQEQDFVGRIVSRVFGIMSRAGAFLPPPDVLNGRRVQFEFKSAVQEAQKRINVAAASATFEQVLPLAQYKPEIMDNFDADAIARFMAEANGMPHKLLVGQDQVAAIRQARAQAMAAQAAMAAGTQVAEAAGAAAPAMKLLTDQREQEAA